MSSSVPKVLLMTALMCGLMSVPVSAQEESIGPAVGQTVPDFDLPVTGTKEDVLTLSKAYHDGNVVVVFLRGYPGYQCPICSRQVGAILNRSKALAEAAAKVVLVYPGPQDQLDRRSREFLGARRLPDSVVMVRDADMKVTEAWNLRWNGKRETAYPSTFVIDSNGRVVWKKVSTSHAGRSTVEEIMSALRQAGRK